MQRGLRETRSSREKLLDGTIIISYFDINYYKYMTGFTVQVAFDSH